MITRRPSLLLALTLLVMLTVLSTAPALATFPGPDGRIAFVDEDGQLHAINPDGSGLVQLTDLEANRRAAHPDWSASGERLLFNVFRDGGAIQQVWSMHADGSHERRIAGDDERFFDHQPTHTPEARHIVFIRCGDGCAVWMMRANGTQKRKLTPFSGEANLAFDEWPSISPDGNRIAFTRFNGDGFGARVFVMRADGSHLHPISPPRLEAGVPDWSPNGRRITFTSNGAHFFGSRIFTMRANGKDVQPVTPDRYPHNDEGASYSPQGDRIIYGSDRNYPDYCCLDFFASSPSGSGEQAIDTGLPGASQGYPAWGTAPLIP